MKNIKKFSEFKSAKYPYIKDALKVIEDSDRFVWNGRRNIALDPYKYLTYGTLNCPGGSIIDLTEIKYHLGLLNFDFETLTEYNGFLTEA